MALYQERGKWYIDYRYKAGTGSGPAGPAGSGGGDPWSGS